jgi:chromosomal replication initiation ATPase DnaA
MQQSTLGVGNTLVISLNRQIELTENEQDVVLAQAQAVFNSRGISEDNQTIEKIQFMTDNQRFLRTIKKENNNQVSSVYNKVSSGSSAQVSSSVYKDIENKSDSAETQGLELPKGKWGKVCAAFISEYGYELYKHWLESLSVEQTASTIELKTSSGMVRDRIEQNYMPFLSKVAQSTGINKITLI